MISLLTRVKIGPRLAASFFTLLLAMSALCGLALWSLAELAHSLSEIKQERLPKVERLVGIADNVNLVARQTRNLLLFDDATKQASWFESIAKARAENARLVALVAPAIRSPEGRKLVERAQGIAVRYEADLDLFIEKMKNGEVGEATDLLEKRLRESQLAFAKAIDDIKLREIERVGETADHGQESYERARILVLVGGAALLGLGGLLSWTITRSIVSPLRRAVRDAERMAAGDLSEPVTARGRDEAADMLRALGGMQQGLRQIVSDVREGVVSVATASHQIAQGNQDLSARTEEQASSLQQTAASMEQISGNVRAGAESAAHADKLAIAATGMATSGGVLVERAVSQINELEAASKRIADIVGVIDGIAFQTNLLALNAAVEAARAGESGRGFAVVAGEVRSLAGRCAEAAKEIKRLVGSSVEHVQDSSATVRSTGQVMGEIVEQIRLVSALVGEISNASREQDEGIAQVHQAVGELDQMTQNNAALVEESTAAAESLRQQAARLTASVSAFRLESAA